MSNEIKKWFQFLMRHKVRLIAWLLCLLMIETIALKSSSDIFSRVASLLVGIIMSYTMVFRMFDKEKLK